MILSRYSQLWLVLILFGCSDNIQFTDADDIVLNEILPESLRVEIPDVISAPFERPDTVMVTGRIIYEDLRHLIWLSEKPGQNAEALIDELIAAEIDSALNFEIVSAMDGRMKLATIQQRVSLEGKRYRYQLEVSDEDGSRAVQLYWNIEPRETVIIISPYDLNRNESELADTRYRIDYSTEDTGYQETMIVSISHLPDRNPETLQVFVGRSSNLLDISGNTNHPDITLIDPSFTGGRNYAFNARVDRNIEVAVALISLPPSAVDNNESLFDDFILAEVLQSEITSSGLEDASIINEIIMDASAPGYFIGMNGFISSGADIPENPAFSPAFLDLSGLIPFVPREVRDLSVEFN